MRVSLDELEPELVRLREQLALLDVDFGRQVALGQSKVDSVMQHLEVERVFCKLKGHVGGRHVTRALEIDVYTGW